MAEVEEDEKEPDVQSESSKKRKRDDDDGLKVKRNLKGSEEVLKAKFSQYMKKMTNPVFFWNRNCKVFISKYDDLQHINQPQFKIPSNRKTKESPATSVTGVLISKN